jgi:hypothetical protein
VKVVINADRFDCEATKQAMLTYILNMQVANSTFDRSAHGMLCRTSKVACCIRL